MKKKCAFALFLLVNFASIVSAQNFEPEFVGEVNLISNNEATPLEKEYVTIKTKAGASMYIVGVGKVKSKINVKGTSSNIRAKKNSDFYFIVKAVDNQSDPMSIISVFQFEKTSSARKAELSSFGTFGGHNDNKLKLVEYTAKKYGDSSYLLTLVEPPVGEFGIMVKNPNNRDEKSTIVACFGIDR